MPQASLASGAIAGPRSPGRAGPAGRPAVSLTSGRSGEPGTGPAGWPGAHRL